MPIVAAVNMGASGARVVPVEYGDDGSYQIHSDKFVRIPREQTADNGFAPSFRANILWGYVVPSSVLHRQCLPEIFLTKW